jgi:hypothetical protein
MTAYTPRTGEKCTCKPGIERDNCPRCEGSGWVIDFAAIHARRKAREEAEQARKRETPTC